MVNGECGCRAQPAGGRPVVQPPAGRGRQPRGDLRGRRRRCHPLRVLAAPHAAVRPHSSTLTLRSFAGITTSQIVCKLQISNKYGRVTALKQ
jgi:hypothetical protein